MSKTAPPGESLRRMGAKAAVENVIGVPILPGAELSLDVAKFAPARLVKAFKVKRRRNLSRVSEGAAPPVELETEGMTFGERWVEMIGGPANQGSPYDLLFQSSGILELGGPALGSEPGGSGLLLMQVDMMAASLDRLEKRSSKVEAGLEMVERAVGAASARNAEVAAELTTAFRALTTANEELRKWSEPSLAQAVVGPAAQPSAAFAYPGLTVRRAGLVIAPPAGLLGLAIATLGPAAVLGAWPAVAIIALSMLVVLMILTHDV